MNTSRLSLTAFVFGLLALTAFVYAVPLFYMNYSAYTALQESVREGTPSEQVISHLGRTMGLGLLFVLVVLTAIFLLATVLLFKKVIAPIKKLERAFAELRAGDLSAHVVPEGLSEIFRIDNDFNDATKTVREKTEALAAATAALQDVNEKLEAEFRQAKKLNDLTVGRELAMVKMKEEMETLKRAVSRSAGQ